jgi:FkbM family methyltransferase
MTSITINGHEIAYENRQAFYESVERGWWEPSSFEVLDKYVKPGKVFIDIGAWTGILSIYASNLGAKVYSVEPDARAFEELTGAIALNGCDIKTSLVAMSSHNGIAELNTMTPGGFGNSESSLVKRGDIEGLMLVQTRTLETFIQEQGINPEGISLIKIDTEGGEVLIFEQAKEFLTKHKPTIYISFHPAWFANFGEAVNMFIDTIFPIYEVIGVTTPGKVYSEGQFVDAMHSKHDHSFILKAK